MEPSTRTIVLTSAISALSAILGAVVAGSATILGQYYSADASKTTAEIQAKTRRDIEIRENDRRFIQSIMAGSPANSRDIMCNLMIYENTGMIPNEWITALVKNYESRGVSRSQCKGV